MLVVEFFYYGLYLFLFIGRKRRNVGIYKVVELSARLDELYAHFVAFFPVLLVLGLFVLGFGSFSSIVDSVDFVDVFFCDFLCLCVCALCGNLLHKTEVGIIDGGQKSEDFRIFVGYCAEIDRIVRNYLVLDFACFPVGNEYEHRVYARVLNFDGFFIVDGFACVRHNFARFGIYDILCYPTARQTVGKVELFIELIPADFYNVVTARIEKEVVEMLSYGSFGGNFAGAKSSVKLDKSVGFGFRGILCDSVFYHLVVRKQIHKRSVRTEAERAQKHRRADFTFSVDVYPHYALSVLFKL